MKIICVTNRKGGVGKTTMTVHIAAGLAMKGYRVGIVDLDSQGHIATALSHDKADNLFAALIDRKPLSEVVTRIDPDAYAPTQESAHGELYTIFSDKMTFRIPYMLEDDSAFVLLEMFEAFADYARLDYVFVDTQPTMSLLDTALFAAADGYIFVTECEALSFDGIREIQGQVKRFAKQREKFLQRETRLLGIIPNRMRADTILHRTNISSLAQAFPDLVFSPVILRIAWAEAFNLHQLIYSYAPDGKESADAWNIVHNIERRLKAWREMIASVTP